MISTGSSQRDPLRLGLGFGRDHHPKSAPARRTAHPRKPKTATVNSGFNENAVSTSKWTSARTARVLPHPGHG